MLQIAHQSTQVWCLVPLLVTFTLQKVSVFRVIPLPHFLAYGLNTEIYGVSLRIQSECGKMRTRITPNTDTFYAVFPILFRNFLKLNIDHALYAFCSGKLWLLLIKMLRNVFLHQNCKNKFRPKKVSR